MTALMTSINSRSVEYVVGEPVPGKGSMVGALRAGARLAGGKASARSGGARPERAVGDGAGHRRGGGWSSWGVPPLRAPESGGELLRDRGADSRAAPVGPAAAACFRRRRAPTVALATLLRDQPLSTRKTSFALERGRLTGRPSAPAPGCSARPRSARRTPPAGRARTATPPTASA